MEPITMTVVAALAVGATTYRPKWEDQFYSEKSPNTLVLPKQETTSVPLIERRSNLLNSGKVIGSLKEKLYQELMTFIPTGNENPEVEPVSKIGDILAANEFLQKLPGSVPVPILMRNDEGQIGMYWDNDHMFIGIDVESNSTVSFYTRDQNTGVHSFIDEVRVGAINAAWFESNIGELLKPNAVLA